MMLPRTSQQAKTTRQFPSEKPSVFMRPTTGGPSRPAKLAQILMNPIDTAAAEDDIVKVVNTQNGVGQKNAKKPIRHNQPNTMNSGWPGMRLTAKQTPVNTWPATQCHFRSSVRSEDLPEN